MKLNLKIFLVSPIKVMSYFVPHEILVSLIDFFVVLLSLIIDTFFKVPI